MLTGLSKNTFQIEKYLDALATMFPDLLKLETGGKSYEGRRMRVARISTNPNSNNPVIFVEAGNFDISLKRLNLVITLVC